MVFYISAGIYLIGAVFFLIFAEGEVQPWVMPYLENDKPQEKDVKMGLIAEDDELKKDRFDNTRI